MVEKEKTLFSNVEEELVLFRELKTEYIKHSIGELPKVSSSQSAADYLKHIWTKERYIESIYVLYLSNSNNVIGYKRLSMGSVKGCVVDVSILVKHALDCLAQNVILSHNHPSEKKVPSGADIKLTKEIKEALYLFRIKLLDHIIIADFDKYDDYYSFQDEGKM